MNYSNIIILALEANRVGNTRTPIRLSGNPRATALDGALATYEKGEEVWMGHSHFGVPITLGIAADRHAINRRKAYRKLFKSVSREVTI